MNAERLTRVVARLAAPIFLFLATVALTPAHAGAPHPAPAASHEPLQSLGAGAAEGVWTCPMHAEVHEHAPGKCPICKMKLVKAKPRRA
ncbi:heavy metal-binding domain-containing protein [Thiobacillus sedimenti]|uniref:Heavy metal-binding domain-containing protein n=1 Tax=Thiobacillus sedimenti TaxID=3110231 RepID=A0ABZ1CJY1_9PROT|nr:heavy metal-binding domain-containing protein [Thiobacillus sp. SCUT-2]WRS39688.1 heavy metal-binding domain-containing protein [Thiobacillus sp. SCUT-2]